MGKPIRFGCDHGNIVEKEVMLQIKGKNVLMTMISASILFDTLDKSIFGKNNLRRENTAEVMSMTEV